MEYSFIFLFVNCFGSFCPPYINMYGGHVYSVYWSNEGVVVVLWKHARLLPEPP